MTQHLRSKKFRRALLAVAGSVATAVAAELATGLVQDLFSGAWWL